MCRSSDGDSRGPGADSPTLEDARVNCEALARDPARAGISELFLLHERVEGAKGMARGLRKGARVLEALESLEEEHRALVRDIDHAEAKASDLHAVLDVHQQSTSKKMEVSASEREPEDPFALFLSFVDARTKTLGSMLLW